jgi:hypothetical protein
MPQAQRKRPATSQAARAVSPPRRTGAARTVLTLVERREQDERAREPGDGCEEAHVSILARDFAPFVSSGYGNR